MRTLSYLMLVLALALAALLLAGLVWVAAHIDWSHRAFSAAFWTETPEDVRNAVLVFGGVVAAAIGLALAAVRTHAADVQARAANEQARVANVQAKLAEQGHITDRFTKAIEQLGSDRLEIRLGAIYALERIARDSRRDHGPIMETLTAYVRQRAPWSSAASGGFAEDHGAPPKGLATDIQATLTVIGRRYQEHDVADQSLHLRETDLRNADLRGAHLKGADLGRAHLEGATLRDAHLEGATLHGAHLEGVILRGAHLEGADLRGAHLEGADLRGAQGLAQAQLDKAYGDEQTELPGGFTIGTTPRARTEPAA